MKYLSNKKQRDEALAQLCGEYVRAADEQWEMGIDEAGRGPVLGPLVYACCYWPVRLRDRLSQFGFADSKQLTEEQRDILFEVLQALQQANIVGFEVQAIGAEQLSNRMLARIGQKNLNTLSFNAAYTLIDTVAQTSLAQAVPIAHCYVDTVGSASVYQNKLQIDYPSLTFTVSEKADSRFPIVSAASIVAKVTRDKQVRQMLDIEDNQCGSGYPADPITKQWLNRNFDAVFAYPSQIARYSWSTVQKLFDQHKLQVDFRDKENKAVGMQSMRDFVHSDKQKKQGIFQRKFQIQSEDFEI